MLLAAILLLSGCSVIKQVSTYPFSLDGVNYNISITKGAFHLARQSKSSFFVRKGAEDIALGYFISKDLGDSYIELAALEFGTWVVSDDGTASWTAGTGNNAKSVALLPSEGEDAYVMLESLEKNENLKDISKEMTVQRSGKGH